MEDYGYDLITALKKFYNSETFAKLSDEVTGLYIESSAYVYEILKVNLSTEGFSKGKTRILCWPNKEKSFFIFSPCLALL